MRLATITLLVIFLLAIAGCGPVPAQDEAGDEELVDEPLLEVPVQTAQVQEPEIAQDNTSDIADLEQGVEITGSLELQDDLSKCPHLMETFDCDRYDISRCKFKNLVGKDEFYPDYIYCRDGRLEHGESAGRKYCFIQECRLLEKENIVYAYGGPVTWGEYIYTVDKVDGGIMTHYQLVSCGEDRQEFKTSFDCTTYRSTLDNI
ncbi:MAG: hypothetical protein V1729_06320 [Candidatus Woesearchaeota archaeon]